MLCTITRRPAGRTPCYPSCLLHRPGPSSLPQHQHDPGSRAVLTIPVCAGTRGQVGAQHHGRDQVLKGWDLNQWQPEEGDNNGTLERKDRQGNRAAPKAQAAGGTGVGRKAHENPKVARGYPIFYMCPSISQVTAHGMDGEVRGFSKLHSQPLWEAQASDDLKELCMMLEQGSEELEGKHTSFSRGVCERGRTSVTTVQRCSLQRFSLCPLPFPAKLILPHARKRQTCPAMALPSSW